MKEFLIGSVGNVDILSMLKGMDKKQLDEAVKKAKEFGKTQQGRQIIDKLRRGERIDGLPISGAEQERIMKEIPKNPELSARLSEILGTRE